jgi:hypothetical protein
MTILGPEFGVAALLNRCAQRATPTRIHAQIGVAALRVTLVTQRATTFEAPEKL